MGAVLLTPLTFILFHPLLVELKPIPQQYLINQVSYI